MNKSKLLGLFSLVGAAFFGGAVMPSLIRTGTSYLHPFLFNWVRTALGAFLLLVLFREKYPLNKILIKENILLFLVLGLGFGLNITLFSFAINHTTLIASQLVYVLVPVVTSFLAFLIIKEKINKQKILGMILSLTGVLILILSSRSSATVSTLGTIYGNALIFIGMIGYSAYLTFSKKFNFDKSALEMLILANVSLSIFFSPLALYEILFGAGLPQLNWQATSSLIIVVIASLSFTGLTQLSIKNLAASTASLGSLLSPEFAALTGIIFYQEKLSFTLILSLVLAMSGVIISTSTKHQLLMSKLKSSSRKLSQS